MTLRGIVAVFFLGSTLAFAQQSEDLPAQVKVKVLDEAGVPVGRARVVLSTYASWVPGRRNAGGDEHMTQVGATGPDGVVALTLKSASGRYGCMVLPLPEFHWDRGKEYVFTNAVAGRWDPWGPEVTIVLKRKNTDYTPLAEAAPVTGKAGGTDVSKDPLVARPLQR
jgi:hypothetical protein